MTWKVYAAAAALVVLATATVVTTIHDYRTNQQLQRSVRLADSLATAVGVVARQARAADAALRQSLASDNISRIQRDSALAAARRSESRYRAFVATLPPLPEVVPAECADILARHDRVMYALLDAGMTIDSLNKVVAIDTRRIDSLRADMVTAADTLDRITGQLDAATAALARLRDGIPTKTQPPPARLQVLGEVRAIAGGPVVISGALGSDIGWGVTGYVGVQQELRNGEKQVIIGARKTLRLW